MEEGMNEKLLQLKNALNKIYELLTSTQNQSPNNPNEPSTNFIIPHMNLIKEEKWTLY